MNTGSIQCAIGELTKTDNYNRRQNITRPEKIIKGYHCKTTTTQSEAHEPGAIRGILTPHDILVNNNSSFYSSNVYLLIAVVFLPENAAPLLQWSTQ